MLCGCAAIQGDKDRLENWTQKMSVKFNKGKWRVLHLGTNSLGHPGKAGGLENSSVGRIWEAWGTGR